MNDEMRDAVMGLEAAVDAFRKADDNRYNYWDRDRQDVLARLCNIGRIVGGEHYRNEYAADCFCREAAVGGYRMSFQYDDIVLDFIEAAVREKMERDGSPYANG